MAKEFIVRISYTDYAIQKSDAVALLDIASRMKVVKQNGYSGPYYIQPDQEVWLDSLSMHDVLTPEPDLADDAPDVFLAATRDVSPF
jgi:hypothetical protein